MKFLLYITTFFVLFASCANSKMTLNEFVYEQDQLPANCVMKVVSKGDRLPCTISTNPYISSEPSFLDCFIENLSTDPAMRAQLINGLFSVYETTKEIGIIGFELKTEQAAKDLEKILRDIGTFVEHGNIYQKNQFVIVLWADQTTDPAFAEFEKLLENTLGIEE